MNGVHHHTLKIVCSYIISEKNSIAKNTKLSLEGGLLESGSEPIVIYRMTIYHLEDS